MLIITRPGPAATAATPRSSPGRRLKPRPPSEAGEQVRRWDECKRARTGNNILYYNITYYSISRIDYIMSLY